MRSKAWLLTLQMTQHLSISTLSQNKTEKLQILSRTTDKLLAWFAQITLKCHKIHKQQMKNKKMNKYCKKRNLRRLPHRLQSIRWLTEGKVELENNNLLPGQTEEFSIWEPSPAMIALVSLRLEAALTTTICWSSLSALGWLIHQARRDVDHQMHEFHHHLEAVVTTQSRKRAVWSLIRAISRSKDKS